jgi:DNA recombination-dependent growth factor C
MDDTPHHKHPAGWEPPMPSEAELLASLAQSEADLAAGRIVPASVVHEELRAALERIEARRGQRRGTVARR